MHNLHPGDSEQGKDGRLEVTPARVVVCRVSVLFFKSVFPHEIVVVVVVVVVCPNRLLVSPLSWFGSSLIRVGSTS